MSIATESTILGERALRETLRTPDSLIPTLFIPLFFLVVNVGQAGKIFPSASTGFLNGQGYGAFQLPSSLLLAASWADRPNNRACRTSSSRPVWRGSSPASCSATPIRWRTASGSRATSRPAT